MEKLKCRFLLLFVLLLLLVSTFISKDVNALELTHGSEYTVTSGWISGDGESDKVNGVVQGADFTIDNLRPEYYYTNLSLNFNKPVPANSLFHMTVVFSAFGSNSISNFGWQYNGLDLGGFTILSDSCYQLSNTPNVYRTERKTISSFTCDILAFTNQSVSTSRSIINDRIFRLVGSSSNSSDLYGQIMFSDLRSRLISFNGLTDDDRAWLQENMPEGSSTSDIESAIESAREEEKSEYEEQANETENTANDESSAAQSTATSLLSVVGQFIGVLTSAQPTNCNLNGNLIPHLPIGTLNLCQNDPPAAIVVLGSLLLIAFVVPLAYHTVKRMINLIGSFQN